MPPGRMAFRRQSSEHVAIFHFPNPEKNFMCVTCSILSFHSTSFLRVLDQSENSHDLLLWYLTLLSLSYIFLSLYAESVGHIPSINLDLLHILDPVMIEWKNTPSIHKISISEVFLYFANYSCVIPF